MSSRIPLAPRFTITNAITATLSEIERVRGLLEAAALADAWVDAMRAEAFLLEAHYTKHSEGARLTQEDATKRGQTAWSTCRRAVAAELAPDLRH